MLSIHVPGMICSNENTLTNIFANNIAPILKLNRRPHYKANLPLCKAYLVNI